MYQKEKKKKISIDLFHQLSQCNQQRYFFVGGGGGGGGGGGVGFVLNIY